MTHSLPFDNSYVRLDAKFFAAASPTPVSAPRLIALNRDLAQELGLDLKILDSPLAAEIFAGNLIPYGAEPLAMAYAGHQFGNFVPQLGDGRAILLGEVIDRSGIRRDIQLKGAGQTAFSRRGDGRAALGPVLREYLVSEAMAAFGIPTTRALAAVTTGDVVMRDRPLPGAVLTRVATSHVRVGTFQFFAARGDMDGVRQLADYVIDRHAPEARATANPYLGLLEWMIGRQSALIARWLLIGFIHGVMNTDNMSVVGETIDFGPCAFMDAYDPQTVFSSIDVGGRYAYGNQSRIALWNLSRLAECLLPLLAADEDQAIALANQAMADYADRFNAAYADGMRQKLGLHQPHDDDLKLATDLLSIMAASHADFTLTFRRLGEDRAVELFTDPGDFLDWRHRWHRRLGLEGATAQSRQPAMNRVNPALIPRNHRIEEVIEAAVEDQDFDPFHHLHQALRTPFEDKPEFAHFQSPPRPEERVLQTFCGT